MREAPGGAGARGAPASSMTPMIDVVFLLIIFFMLVAQISRQRVMDLDLPALVEPTAGDPRGAGSVIVNVAPEGSAAGAYRVGATWFGAGPSGLAGLTEALRGAVSRGVAAVGAGESGVVLVRADRSERTERVRPAIEAAREAGASRVELIVVERVP